MGFARVAYAPGLLLELLHLPPETRIVGADMSHSHGEIVLTLGHPDLSDVPIVAGVRPRVAHPQYQHQAPIRFLDWGQD